MSCSTKGFYYHSPLFQKGDRSDVEEVPLLLLRLKPLHSPNVLQLSWFGLIAKEGPLSVSCVHCITPILPLIFNKSFAFFINLIVPHSEEY